MVTHTILEGRSGLRCYNAVHWVLGLICESGGGHRVYIRVISIEDRKSKGLPMPNI